MSLNIHIIFYRGGFCGDVDGVGGGKRQERQERQKRHKG